MKEVLSLVLLSWIAIIIFLFAFTGVFESNKEQYKDYKNDTKVINGKVTEAKEQSRIILPAQHFLNVKTKDNKNIRVSTNKKIFNNYQKDSEIKFRIDTKNNNKVKKDLKTQKDIKTYKDYEDDRTKNDLFAKAIK